MRKISLMLILLVSVSCKNLENYSEPKEKIVSLVKIKKEELQNEMQNNLNNMTNDEKIVQVNTLEYECEVKQEFSNTIFEINQSIVKGEFKESIFSNARELVGKKGKLFIVGYADKTGTDSINLKISNERAKSVEDLYKVILKNENIETYSLGVGSKYPEYDNNSKSGREKNRRVKVYFLEDKGK